MGVVRSRLVSTLVSGAAAVLVGVGGVALAGPAAASEQAPGYDPAIAEQQVTPETPPPADPATEGCVENPVICQGGIAPAGVGTLPRTGPQQDRLLEIATVGGGPLLAGAGAVVAGRRRATA